MYTQKSPMYTQQRLCTLDSVVHSRLLRTQTKELYIHSKEPYIHSKEPMYTQQCSALKATTHTDKHRVVRLQGGKDP